jgi:hypothetical protein
MFMFFLILSLQIHGHLFTSARVQLVIKKRGNSPDTALFVFKAPQDGGGTESKQ